MGGLGMHHGGKEVSPKVLNLAVLLVWNKIVFKVQKSNASGSRQKKAIKFSYTNKQNHFELLALTMATQKNGSANAGNVFG